MTKPNHISFRYTLKDKKGALLDNVTDPIGFVEGHEQIFPKLEKQIVQRTVGDSFEVSLAADDAYGQYQDDLLLEIPMSDVEGSLDIGDKLIADDGSGNEMSLEVVDKKENAFILDGNHPLAGQDLVFNIEIVSSRPATEDEISAVAV